MSKKEYEDYIFLKDYMSLIKKYERVKMSEEYIEQMDTPSMKAFGEIIQCFQDIAIRESLGTYKYTEASHIVNGVSIVCTKLKTFLNENYQRVLAREQKTAKVD